MRRIHQSQQGFTLIELLVSIAIFSMMTVAAYAGIASIMSSDKVSLEHETALKKLQRTFVFIEKDLRQLSTRTRNTGYSDLLAALKSDGSSETGLLEFTRAGNSNPTDLARSSLQRVRYVLEDKKLQRLSWNLVDHNDAEPLLMNLLEDVTEINLSFYSEGGETSAEWTKVALPIGVEIKISTERWGEVRRVLPIYY